MNYDCNKIEVNTTIVMLALLMPINDHFITQARRQKIIFLGFLIISNFSGWSLSKILAVTKTNQNSEDGLSVSW